MYYNSIFFIQHDRVTHDEQRTWNLLIKNVQPEDEGCYMCQINTAVMKKELGCISVLGNQLNAGIQNEFQYIIFSTVILQ